MGGVSLPPGFRFHPTDEELVGYYLKRKVEALEIELEVIPVIDLYKFDPWDLPEKSFLPNRDLEWFFFCPRDCKYPNGSRTNRATKAGYWKATGKGKKVVCQFSPSASTVTGYRKTLVFYRGRAPLGDRTNWVMHEYRLCDDLVQPSPSFRGAFALCRVIKKNEKANDFKAEVHNGKRAAGSSSCNGNDTSMRVTFSNELLSISCDISSQASQMCNESSYSSPIASPCPYNVTPMPSMATNPSDFCISPDMILDSSKEYCQEHDVVSGYFPHHGLSKMTPWQSFNYTDISSSSSYSNCNGGIEFSDDISRIGCIRACHLTHDKETSWTLYGNEDVPYEGYDQFNGCDEGAARWDL
ncbi:hypothetical protein TanjilG_27823 [Lupinus angustifolius]|uniref:NAC domain-containing protein n=1 Tax=Lupinus angustifolius TaxID=3871 RepID=A0A4P1RHB3_LUPAN|nr:PREDICTED: NAC domain-containing protein 86-like [Lupinus angustifolius]OIW10877.1 hypothetical protein TanjilG_27823 [Lupinus angustifolius]